MNYFKQSLFKNILMTKIWLSGPPWGPRRARGNIFSSHSELLNGGSQCVALGGRSHYIGM